MGNPDDSELSQRQETSFAYKKSRKSGVRSKFQGISLTLRLNEDELPRPNRMVNDSSVSPRRARGPRTRVIETGAFDLPEPEGSRCD